MAIALAIIIGFASSLLKWSGVRSWRFALCDSRSDFAQDHGQGSCESSSGTGKGLGPAFATAFRGGATVGLAVPAMALIAITVLFFVYPDPLTIAGVGIGASLIVLFIRACGRRSTKSADLGADLVGKVEAGIPEDDPRNPATIAENAGDNVGDVAGMGSDVYESYIVTIMSQMPVRALVVLKPRSNRRRKYSWAYNFQWLDLG